MPARMTLMRWHIIRWSMIQTVFATVLVRISYVGLLRGSLPGSGSRSPGSIPQEPSPAILVIALRAFIHTVSRAVCRLGQVATLPPTLKLRRTGTRLIGSASPFRGDGQMIASLVSLGSNPA